MLARDPPGNVFDIARKLQLVEYSLSAKALEAGVYHVHTQLNVAQVGPGLGPGQTVVVEGDPIIKPIPYTNIAYQSIYNWCWICHYVCNTTLASNLNHPPIFSFYRLIITINVKLIKPSFIFI